MTTTVELLSLGVMAVFGVATAGLLAYMMRDLVARVAEGPAERATRIAVSGAVVYLAGFLVVLGGVLLDLERVAGVRTTTLGIAVIVLAGVPMGVGLYLAATRG